jgi:hypothetical protein
MTKNSKEQQMTSKNSYSVTETEQLIMHALDSSKRMTKQRLAHYLDVPPPRISEGLRGVWRLNDDLKQKLIDNFGQPRGIPGCYVQAEVSDSISDFLAEESELSQKRHLQTVVGTFCDAGFLQQLAGEVVPWPPGTYSPPVLESKQVTETLSSLERFMLSPVFFEWLGALRRGHERLNNKKCSPSDLEPFFWASTYYDIELIDEIPIPVGSPNLSHIKGLRTHAAAEGLDLEKINALDLASVGAAFLALREEKNYRTAGLKKPLSMARLSKYTGCVEIEEFVLTGDSIWNQEGFFKISKRGLPFDDHAIFHVPGNQLQQTISPTFERIDRLEFPISKGQANWDVDCWSTYRVELFLRRDCNYSLVIELGNEEVSRVPKGYHHPLRKVVIPNITGRHILDHLNELRGWLELDELPEQSIKERIAEAGGYIPGAQIL